MERHVASGHARGARERAPVETRLSGTHQSANGRPLLASQPGMGRRITPPAVAASRRRRIASQPIGRAVRVAARQRRAATRVPGFARNSHLAVNLVDAARRFVVRTNGWPGAGALYNRAYDLGLASVVARIGAVDGVPAVMLRVNDDGHRWVPGLSDYDLTVIVARRDTVGTLRLLDDLWERYE